MTAAPPITLAGFILARVAEDVAAVEHASDDGSVSIGNDGAGWPTISRSRVLAECEAKRRIVELHAAGEMADHDEFECTCGFADHRKAVCLGCGETVNDEGEYDRGVHNRPCRTIGLLALSYADHPDYRPEWRP